MNRSRFRRIAPFVYALVLIASPALALDLVSQDPRFETFVIGVEEPVTLVFDASLAPASVTTDSVFLTRVDDASVVAASVAVGTTNIADDTVVLTPDADLRFGVRYRLTVTGDLEDTGANAFSGGYPFGREFVPNVPRDLDFPTCAPNDFDCLISLTAPFMGFNPTDPEGTNPNKIYTIPGVSATEAWKWATGRPDVVIAVIDDGMSTYADADLRDRFWINTGETPEPRIGDAPCGVYDCNDDGRVSASDWALDNRVLAESGADPVDVSHLLAAFSDGVDDDGNGFADDISGWDFFRDVNEVLGVDEFPEGTHGDGADNIVGTPENGSGSLIGFCPNCTFLPLRTSDAVMVDYNLVGAAADYALATGVVKVISIAMGAMNYSAAAHQAIVDAADAGILTVAPGGDLLGFQNMWPGAGEDVLNVKALFPFAPIEILGPISVELAAFTESYCTNYGAHTHISMPAGHICTSEATANVSGSAALIISRARDIGIELSANEVKQIIIMSADDIYERCISLVEGPSGGGVCRHGWDEHFGYGRLNLKKAFDMLGYPEESTPPMIPPVARMRKPIWWTVQDPETQPTVTVEAQMSARAAEYRWEIQGAAGHQPYNRDFVVLASGTETDEVDGPIATVDVSSLMKKAEWSRPPEDENDKTITIRLQVFYDKAGKTVMGEDRKSIQLHADRDPETGIMDNFPIALGASVESSPRLVDLDGDPDGRMEIVFATSLGTVEAFKYDGDTGEWAEAPGFPVDISGDGPSFADGVLGAVAIGDLLGDGLPKIVVATLGGNVYAIHHDGTLNPDGPIVEGFPVAVDPNENADSFDFGHGNAIVASPALADLDLDGTLDIVIGSYDQKAYAWSPIDADSDGEADRMPGWPVLLSSLPGVVPANKVCGDALPAQVLGSPAVAVLDPDNANADIAEHPAVVIPTSEVCTEFDLLPTSRMYAVYWNGADNADGPFLPGWPAELSMPLGDAIPIPPLTTGANNSPAVWIDDEGIANISAGGFLWFPAMVKYDGAHANVRTFIATDRLNVTTASNGTFARFGLDEKMHFFLPTVGLLNIIDKFLKLESWNIVGFDLESADVAVQVFRERWEDVQIFVNPIVADISGDNVAEVIAGSGGYNVRAYDINREQPEGWPKPIHNWAIASVAVGDLDRDDHLEVVLPTHEGNLFAWNTRGRECKNDRANSDWWTFRHDERNTGAYHTDTRAPRMVTDLVAEDLGGGEFRLTFAAPGDDGGCGTVAGFDVRYSTSADANLRERTTFLNASAATISSGTPVMGGQKQTLVVSAPDAQAFSIRAFDDEGQASWPSGVAFPQSGGDDDLDGDPDTADDDDDAAPTPAGDDDDDDGCGC